jgi:hypothetical protein
MMAKFYEIKRAQLCQKEKGSCHHESRTQDKLQKPAAKRRIPRILATVENTKRRRSKPRINPVAKLDVAFRSGRTQERIKEESKVGKKQRK